MAAESGDRGTAISFLASLRATAAELGWPLTALYLLHRALQSTRVGRIVPFALVTQPIGCGSYAALRDDPHTRVYHAGSDDELSSQFPRPREVNLDRWRQGATCHVATYKGEFAGTLWVQRGDYIEDEVRCTYRPIDAPISAWDFDVFVLPKYRPGRMLGRLWRAVDDELQQAGVRWTFSRISRFNGASLRAHARLGAQTVGQALFIVLGPVQLGMFSQPPFLHLSFTEAQRPTLLLHPPAEKA